MNDYSQALQKSRESTAEVLAATENWQRWFWVWYGLAQCSRYEQWWLEKLNYQQMTPVYSRQQW